MLPMLHFICLKITFSGSTNSEMVPSAAILLLRSNCRVAHHGTVFPTPLSPARCHPEERSDEGSAVAFRVISGSPTMGPYSYAAFSCALSSRGAQRRRICGCLSGYFRITHHGTVFLRRLLLRVVIPRSAATKDLWLPFGLFPDRQPRDRIPHTAGRPIPASLRWD